jgi:hypothetical protein
MGRFVDHGVNGFRSYSNLAARYAAKFPVAEFDDRVVIASRPAISEPRVLSSRALRRRNDKRHQGTEQAARSDEPFFLSSPHRHGFLLSRYMDR